MISIFRYDDDDEAITYYDRALAINPKDSGALDDEGAALANLGKNNEAITYLDRSLAVNPKDSAAFQNKIIIIVKQFHLLAILFAIIIFIGTYIFTKQKQGRRWAFASAIGWGVIIFIALTFLSGW